MSFHDGSSKMLYYKDGTCPRNKNGREKPCKKEGYDKWLDTDSNEITVVFESDQSGNGRGFSPWSNMQVDDLNYIIKFGLINKKYGSIRNAKLVCPKGVRCSPNQIQLRKNRAETKAIELNRFIQSQLANKSNFKGCMNGLL